MKLKLLSLLILAPFFLLAQTSELIVHPHISLPKDSLTSERLISALQAFLAEADQPNEENNWVLETQKIETFILLDEFKGIESGGNNGKENFFKPYLDNVILLSNDQYLIQLSYIGIEGEKATLRASYELIAHAVKDSFKFSSPLLKNTANWKMTQADNNIFHYEETINENNVQTFSALAAKFDEKLKVTDQVTIFYCTDNLPALLKLIGVNYRADYNGRAQSNFSSSLGNKKLIILGNDNASFDNFDPHDLWHDRLSLVISRRKVNKPIDEACAYLYGGSWGLSWEEIFNRFCDKVASNKKTDWTHIKEEPLNFAETRAEHLMADYVVNALIVQQIEKDQGFAGVWGFLNCGPLEKGNANYYASLEKLTGITQKGYNKAVWRMIEREIIKKP